MTVRFSDLDPAINGVKDFVPRNRHPTLVQIFIAIVGLGLLVTSLSVGLDSKSLQIFFTSILLLVMAWYMMDQTQRNRDLVLATEFQNALFASALGLHNKFCLIIRRDGNIVYLDRSFQELFPDFIRQSRRTLDVLLELGAVSRHDCDKIFSALERGADEKVVFKIRTKNNDWLNVVLSIEPIMRPSGFILMRGREFVESRSASDDFQLRSSRTLDRNTISIFSHIMDTMNMGVYMTSTTGVLVYVNPVLEHWLEYKEGEITQLQLSLQDIVVQEGNRNESIDPANFEGEMMLLKKTGGQMKAFINQKIIHDDLKKPIGCTALVHNFIEELPNVKKKLW